jgi:CubicO group peptidase (beta-lactamase class C family)
MDGSYDPRSDRLTLNLGKFGAVEFTRRTRDPALGFYPATPAADRYVYRPPAHEDDGWETASLQATGIELAPFAALAQRILDTQTDWYTAPYIQGLLIAHHGKLILEEYFYGFYRERSHDLRSASKTITGALVGIALDHGAHFRLDSAAYRLFPEYRQLANPDPRKLKITVQDLLTMNSGLACDDNDDKSPGNEDRMYAQTKEPDFYRYTLDLPMISRVSLTLRPATPAAGRRGYCAAVACTVTPPRLNSKRNNHTREPRPSAGANFHSPAASLARRAKYLLGPRFSRNSPTTSPEGSTSTRTVTLIWP